MGQLRVSSGDSGLLCESEWKLLLQCAFLVGQADNSETVRLEVMRSIRTLVPFYAGAFFLVEHRTGNLGSSLLVQPVGHKVLSDELKAYIDASRQGRAERSMHEGSVPGVFLLSDYKVLTYWFETACGPLGVLGLCRTGDAEPFSKRDCFVVEQLSPYIAEKLESLLGAGEYRVLQAGKLRKEYGLTERELDVVQCVAFGMNAGEVARKLSISVATARKHLEHIYRKMGVNDALSLMKVAQMFMKVNAADESAFFG